jgi:hypothetical protein
VTPAADGPVGSVGHPADPSVTISGSRGVQVGDHNTQTNVGLDVGSVPPPQRVADGGTVHNLPVASGVFVGRDLTVLDDLLAGGGAGAVVGQAAVHGLGGIGKTELAVHYARTRMDRYRLVWWVTADTVENVGSGLAALTRRLHPLAALADAQAWAVGWLQSNTSWLLVLDNVEDIDDVSGLLGWVAERGQVLLTTRRDLGNARWAMLGLTPLRLGVLDRAASVDLLRRLTGQDDALAAGRLAAALGDLPLALEQAAAYISQHDGLSIDGYREAFERRFAQLASDAGEGGHERRTVTSVWQVTMAAITARSELAGRVLAVLGWLGPDHLPQDVLTPLIDDALALGDALALLASYNMISRESDAISVHRLVQAVARTAGPAGESGDAAAAVAANLLVQAIPVDPISNVAGWPWWNALLAHIDALLTHLPPDHTIEAALYLGDRAATYRQFQGQVTAAIAQFEQVLTDRRRVLGDDHPNTLNTRNNLALA